MSEINNSILEKMKIQQDISNYQKKINNRSRCKYILGIFSRLKNHIKYKLIINIARARGAKIGNNCSIPWKLAINSNSNLNIGDNAVIQTSRIDLRCNVTIGSYVIIGSDVEILTVSHDCDDEEWSSVKYGLEIEKYAWLATRSFILPTCRVIGIGAVCGAGSVVSRSVPPCSIVAGNPARHIRNRQRVHRQLCTESLLGNDLSMYMKSFKKR